MISSCTSIIESDFVTSNNSICMNEAVELAGEKRQCLHSRLNYCHACEAGPLTQQGADNGRNQTHIELTSCPMKVAPTALAAGLVMSTQSSSQVEFPRKYLRTGEN